MPEFPPGRFSPESPGVPSGIPALLDGKLSAGILSPNEDTIRAPGERRGETHPGRLGRETGGMSDVMASRFLTEDDPKMPKVVFDLPRGPAWYSRPYEYAWAAQFARRGDTVLDAGCGVSHPFKFYLCDVCGEVHACDSDDRILSREEILRAIAQGHGEDLARALPDRYLRDIRYARASVTSLPYKDGTFDRVFCISTLEHLRDACKRRPWLRGLASMLGRLVPRDCYLALREFKRVVRRDGLIILTFDHPRVSLKYLNAMAGELGLEFAGDVSFEIPPSALFCEAFGLRCFRAALRHSSA